MPRRIARSPPTCRQSATTDQDRSQPSTAPAGGLGDRVDGDDRNGREGGVEAQTFAVARCESIQDSGAGPDSKLVINA